MPPSGDHRYFTSTAIFLTEIIKLAISLTFAIYEVSRSLAPSTPATVIFEQIYNAVFSGDGWKLAIPACLYTLQNTLQYVAVGNLDPVHFQILYQLKILTTAIFTVTMLGRSLSPKRWVALVILTMGVSIVSIPSSGSKDTSFMIHDMTDHFFPRSVHELGQVANGMGEVARELTKRTVDGLADVGGTLMKRSATYEGIEEDQNLAPIMNYSIGLSAVIVAALVSGLTGVYFEKVLKDPASAASVWTRNIQLSFYSLFPALFVGIFFKDGEEIAKHGFFDGYNWVVWALILLQAFGGVLASLCINYADNIAKNFATSISIVISFLFSVYFFNVGVSLTVGHSISVRLSYPGAEVTNADSLVPRRHLLGSRLDVLVQRSGPKARPPAAHQHCQLREDDDRPHEHATKRRQVGSAQPAGIGQVHGTVYIAAVFSFAPSLPDWVVSGQAPRRIDGTP